MMDYNGARIQILDVPGIVEGAASGKGRGKEVLSVAINADLVLLLIDVFHTEHYPVLMKEVRDSYIRMNEERPDIRIKATIKGGISIGSTVRLTNIDEETIKAILHEFRITNADVLIRSDINADQLIDSIEGNRKYIPGIVAINKIDIERSCVGEHGLGASCASFVCVRCLVVGAVIGFDFGDHERPVVPVVFADQKFAHE